MLLLFTYHGGIWNITYVTSEGITCLSSQAELFPLFWSWLELFYELRSHSTRINRNKIKLRSQEGVYKPYQKHTPLISFQKTKTNPSELWYWCIWPYAGSSHRNSCRRGTDLPGRHVYWWRNTQYRYGAKVCSLLIPFYICCWFLPTGDAFCMTVDCLAVWFLAIQV